MEGYKHMSTGEVIAEVCRCIERRLEDLGYDLEYPDSPITAILRVLDKAVDYSAGDQIVGFAVAASFLTGIIAAFSVQLPEELSDRLHARVTGA